MNNDYVRFLCGNASAFVATSLVHPMDVIKISKQLNIKPKYNISNLYRGYTVGLLRQSTYSSPNIFIFTQLMNNYKKFLTIDKNKCKVALINAVKESNHE